MVSAQAKNRPYELPQAEAEFRIMDVHKLLAMDAMAPLEFATVSGKGGTQMSQHVIPTAAALAFFVKQHPDLAKTYHISVGSTARKPKPKPTVLWSEVLELLAKENHCSKRKKATGIWILK